GQQRLLTDLPSRRIAFQPRVEAAARHPQHAADDHRRPTNAMRLDERKLHGCSLAKNAAAFFKISRSISSRAFSLRNRRSSALSAPCSVGAVSGSLPNFFTQSRTLVASIPRLLAASTML